MENICTKDYKELEYQLIKAIELKQFDPILFQYKPINEYTKKIFSENKLFFQTIDKFNDSNEGKFSLDTNYCEQDILNYCNRISKDHNIIKATTVYSEIYFNKKKFDKTCESKIKEHLNNTGVGCFTRNNKNNTMWAHYADSEKGICIEYDVSKSIETFICPIPVKYTDDFPILCYLKREGDFISKTVGNKQSTWSYEDEVRILKLNSGSYSINKDAIVSITFGYNCIDSVVIEFIKFLKNNNYMHLKLYKSVEKENQYEKEREDITYMFSAF